LDEQPRALVVAKFGLDRRRGVQVNEFVECVDVTDDHVRANLGL
jgi:hypothetical protein